MFFEQVLSIKHKSRYTYMNQLLNVDSSNQWSFIGFTLSLICPFGAKQSTIVFINSRHILAVLCMQQSHAWGCLFFKILPNFVHFCPNLYIFCPFLPFLWKIAYTLLLSRIGPEIIFLWFLWWFALKICGYLFI